MRKNKEWWVNDFDACGCGKSEAIATMNALLSLGSDIQLEKLLEITLESVSKVVEGVRPPFKILCLNGDKIEQ